VDHTEHDVQVLVSEHGLADLRGLAPRQRAKLIIEKCADPKFRPALTDYLARAEKAGNGLQTPHLLGEAYDWHLRAQRGESM
ncbi:MAG: propionyl-CoA--succinate CoA transferase, partial [Candidatus Accumulibacter sp.]|nr:propionyl-CoA--succinate CoA transferase [Accumulibacter sp.]